jgi:hypothetical protein
MNFTTIITAWTSWQAVELICIVYCADYLHVMGATHRRSRGYDHSTHGQHQAPAACRCGGRQSGLGPASFHQVPTQHRHPRDEAAGSPC